MIQLIRIFRPSGCVNEMGLINLPIHHDLRSTYESTPSESVPSATVHSCSKNMENGQIAPSKVSSLIAQRPISSPDFNVESSLPNDIALFSPNVTPSCDISANPSWSPLSSSLSLPYPPPLFSRPSNILENPEWSPSWLITPPLRKMVPLSKYQVPVTTNFSDYIDAAGATNEHEVAFAVDVAASQT